MGDTFTPENFSLFEDQMQKKFTMDEPKYLLKKN